MKITKTLVEKIVELTGHGLVKGVGRPEAGQMCVEACVCYALGLPHGDDPKCVGQAVRSFKIALNDQNWSSDKARGEGLKRIAIAQLGSDQINQKEFSELLCQKGVNQILPPLFRYLAQRKDCKEPAKFEAHAKECENARGFKACREAAKSASAYAYAYASAYADADAYAYADASADAYADAYADFKNHFGKDFFLLKAADIGCQALIELKSPGAEWLHLVK